MKAAVLKGSTQQAFDFGQPIAPVKPASFMDAQSDRFDRLLAEFRIVVTRSQVKR